MGFALCLLAFVVCWMQGLRSLVSGLGAVLVVGYAHGIVRAQIPGMSTYLLFDAAVAGFYLAWLPRMLSDGSETAARMRPWLVVLIGWPTLLLFAPVQHPFVQLVGWRAAAWFVPFLYVGGRLRDAQVRALAKWMAALNLVACGFAAAEYVWGIELFFPPGPVTNMIYRSHDVASGTAHRIPATFSSSHVYAGTMLLTLPWLLEAWSNRVRGERGSWLLPPALLASVLGVFLAASRTSAIILGVLLLFTIFTRQLGLLRWCGLVLMLTFVMYLVASEERLQRVTTLGNTEYVSQRLGSSIRWTFLDLVARYPLGNGLGGGGTSLPHFLSELAVEPSGQLESEYARILLEQGLLGLAFWVVFIVWVFTRFVDFDRATFFPATLGSRLMWLAMGAHFATGLLGMGLLMAMPGAMLLFMGTGRVIASSVTAPAAAVARRRTLGVVARPPGTLPEYAHE